MIRKSQGRRCPASVPHSFGDFFFLSSLMIFFPLRPNISSLSVIHSDLTKGEHRAMVTCITTLQRWRTFRKASLLYRLNPCLSSLPLPTFWVSNCRLHGICRVIISGAQSPACIQTYLLGVYHIARAGPALGVLAMTTTWSMRDNGQESWGKVKGDREALGCSHPAPVLGSKCVI